MDVGDVFFCRHPRYTGTVPPGLPGSFYGVIDSPPRPYRDMYLVRTTVYGKLDGRIVSHRGWNLIAEDLEILDL